MMTIIYRRERWRLDRELRSSENVDRRSRQVSRIDFRHRLLHLSAGEPDVDFREHSQAHRQSDYRRDRCGRMGDGWEDRIFRTNQGAEGHRPDAGTGRERRRMGSETVQRLSRRPNPRGKARFLHTLRPRRRDADWRSPQNVAWLLAALK